MKLADEPFDAAVIQLASVPGAIEHSVERALALMKKRIEGSRKLRLVCLPEGFDVGYDLETIKRAELSSPPSSLAKIKEFSMQHHLCVAYGSIERIGDKIFNISFLVQPDGQVARYEKTHLFATAPLVETAVFSQGNGKRVVVPHEGISIGMAICYDIRFPEFTRALCIDGAEVVCISSAWPAVRRDVWRTLVTARALENQVFVVAANQAPLPNGCEFAGTSLIVAPDGRILAEGDARQEGIETATIDMAELKRVREAVPLWNHRRPDAYAPHF